MPAKHRHIGIDQNPDSKTLDARFNKSYQSSDLERKSLLDSRFDGLSESEIWSQFRKGSREAFIYMYYKFFPVLFSYGHQLTTHTEVVEDCIQDLFVDLSKKSDNLSDTDSIKFYLIKSFKTKYLKSIKKEEKIKDKVKYYPGYEFQFTLSDEDKLINTQLDDERIAKLNKALEGLTGRQREAIYYFYYENMSIDQIAEILEVTNRRTVQNIIYRALAHMREHIDILLVFFIALRAHQ
ncbi:MAG: RNA polymerase sigma factor [Cyclobacteriaceae bacterium]